MAGEADDGQRFDEAQVRQIFRRAIEIHELTANTIGFRELHEIAASVGIGPEALERALDELRRAEKARRTRLKVLRGVRRVLGVATGLVLGLLATLIWMLVPDAGGNPPLATAVLLAAMVALLAIYHRHRGDQRTYQIDNAAIWAAFAIGAFPASRAAGGIPLGVVAWLVFAVVGILLIGSRRADPPGLSRENVLDRALDSVRLQSGRSAEVERRSARGSGEPDGGRTGPTLATSP